MNSYNQPQFPASTKNLQHLKRCFTELRQVAQYSYGFRRMLQNQQPSSLIEWQASHTAYQMDSSLEQASWNFRNLYPAQQANYIPIYSSARPASSFIFKPQNVYPLVEQVPSVAPVDHAPHSLPVPTLHNGWLYNGMVYYPASGFTPSLQCQPGHSIAQPAYREAVTYPVEPVRYIQNPEEASQYYPQYSRDTAFAAASTSEQNMALPPVSTEMSMADVHLYCEGQTAGAMTQTFSPLRIPPSVSSQDFQCTPEIPADLQSIQTAEKDEQHKTLPQASLGSPEKTETESADTSIQQSSSSTDTVKEISHVEPALETPIDPLVSVQSTPLTTESGLISLLQRLSTFQATKQQETSPLRSDSELSHFSDFIPCVDGATFSYRPYYSSVRKLDPDIEILFSEKDRNQKEKHLQSLARFMGDLPSFKETSQQFLEAKTLFTARSKKKKRSKAKPPTSLTPEIYIDRVMCPAQKGKVVFCKVNAGLLKPYIVPHLATPALKAHLMSIDSHLRNILKFERCNVSDFFNSERYLYLYYLPLFQMLKDTFTMKLLSYLSDAQDAPPGTVTADDLHLHVNVANHLLQICLLNYLSGTTNGSKDSNHHIMTIINCHIAMTETLHSHLHDDHLSSTRQEFHEALYLDMIRAHIALLNHDNMRIIQLISRWCQSVPPKTRFIQDEFSMRYLITIKNVQSLLLNALDATFNNPDYQQLYLEVIRVISNSNLFCPIAPDVLRELRSARVFNAVRFINDLTEQATRISRHLSGLIAKMDELSGSAFPDEPAKCQQLLNSFQEVWVPLLTCNIDKLSGGTFTMKSSEKTRAKLAAAYEALKEREKRGHCIRENVDELVESLHLLREKIEKLSQQLRADEDAEIDRFANEIGEIPHSRQLKGAMKNAKRQPPPTQLHSVEVSERFSESSVEQIPQPPVHKEASESPPAKSLSAFLETIPHQKPAECILALIHSELEDGKALPSQSFCLHAEVALHLLRSQDKAMARLVKAIKDIQVLHKQTEVAIKDLPELWPDRSSALQWLAYYFPKGELESRNIIKTLEAIQLKKLNQAKESINSVAILLKHALEVISPYIDKDIAWGPPQDSTDDSNGSLSSIPSREDVVFLFDTSITALEVADRLKRDLSTTIPVNEALNNRSNIFAALELHRKTSAPEQETPAFRERALMLQLKNDFSKHRNQFNKHNDEPGGFCTTDLTQLISKYQQVKQQLPLKAKIKKD